MKTYKKTIYKLDRVFFDVEEKSVCGDMCYSFGESDDTRTTNKNEAQAGAIYSMRAAIEAGEEEHNSRESIAIYEILKGMATYEAEDDESETDAAGALWAWSVDSWRVVSSVVACCEDHAHTVGLSLCDLGNITFYE